MHSDLSAELRLLREMLQSKNGAKRRGPGLKTEDEILVELAGILGTDFCLEPEPAPGCLVYDKFAANVKK